MPAMFSGETSTAGLSILISLAKATLVLIAALGVTRALERSSAVARHLVWFVALASVLLIPALASWGPLRLEILPADAGAVMPISAPSEPGPVGRGPETSTTSPSVSVPITPKVEATVSTVRDLVSPKTSWYGILRDPALLFSIWATVAVLFAIWLAWGAFMVHRIVRRSRPLDTPSDHLDR